MLYAYFDISDVVISKTLYEVMFVMRLLQLILWKVVFNNHFPPNYLQPFSISLSLSCFILCVLVCSSCLQVLPFVTIVLLHCQLLPPSTSLSSLPPIPLSYCFCLFVYLSVCLSVSLAPTPSHKKVMTHNIHLQVWLFTPMVILCTYGPYKQYPRD